jgi:hypothetical protein
MEKRSRIEVNAIIVMVAIITPTVVDISSCGCISFLSQ